MSKLSEMIAAQETKREPGLVLDISGNCGVCYEDVDEGEYFANHQVLRMQCPQGHVSYLEDFRL